MKTNRFFANPDKLGQIARKIAAQVVVFMLFFAVVSCNSVDLGVPTGTAAGTVVGWFDNGIVGMLLVEVDKKYPIGRSFTLSNESCVDWLPEYHPFQNVIRVQPPKHLPLPNVKRPDDIIGRRIFFSHREYKWDRDGHLIRMPLISGIPNPGCAALNIPIYIITNIQTLN